MTDSWESGDAYEPYVGRWSRAVATELLEWLAVPPSRRWLDVGCGTGAVTTTVLERAAPTEVLAVDASEAYADWAASHVEDPRVRFEVADATQLPADVADVVVSGLVLNFLPDPAAALRAMRAAAPDGVVAAYVWDYAGKMELMRHFWDVVVELDPAARALDEGNRFPICDPSRLETLWRDAGLGEVEVRAIDVPTVFRDFDDYWTPFLGGQGPAPGYATSLDEHRLAQLRDRLRARLPARPDGTIPLVARAWAVRGRAPS